MIKKIAWETFKNTGDINAFMELKEIENIEKEIQEGIIKPIEQKENQEEIIKSIDGKEIKEENQKWQM